MTITLNSIIFNTSYLILVPRPHRLLDIIINDFNNLNEKEKIIYLNKVCENSKQFRTLSNLLRYSNNQYKWFLANQLSRTNALNNTFLLFKT